MILDTNALLWLYRDSPELGGEARRLIAAADRVHFSSVSVLEIVIKNLLGRVDLPGGEDFPAVFMRSGLSEIAFSVAHAATVRDDPALARHDPFDRMLLAQARCERMVLMTSDATLLGLGERWIVDARR